MTAEQYKIIIKDYTEKIETEIETLKNIKDPIFQKIIIRDNEIDEIYFKELIEELQDKGLTKSSSVLYYIKILSDQSQIQKVVTKLKKYKKTSRFYLALPQINNKEKGTSNILYVGKTNSNFNSRLKCHLGLSNNHTYGLQLKYWADKVNLKIELNYAIVSFTPDKIHLRTNRNCFTP